jgi:nitrogen regulatory protein PII-like uncharacterized protein
LAQASKERIHLVAGPLDLNFHAVGVVADRPSKASLIRKPVNKRTKADALHDATDEHFAPEQQTIVRLRV